MTVIKAVNIEQTYELLNSNQHEEIELDFDIDTDDFFNIAITYGDRGAKIKRKKGRFVIKLKKVTL